MKLENGNGFEPLNSGFADRRVVCFTTNAWCRQMGSNHRRSALQADALPTELYLHEMVGMVRFELTLNSF